MQKTKQKLILAIFFISFFIQNIYANGLDVDISLPSGTYNKAIKIELIPSLPNAKTFFSFNPNGTPNDAFLYTGAILLKSSTPIIYFSFIDTKIESKIKQNNYIFNYPNTIFFESGAYLKDGIIKNLQIKNTDIEEIDISFWEIKKDDEIFIIPNNTILKSQENFNINYEFSGSGFISLFSPNEEKKDFIEIIDQNKLPNKDAQINPIINKSVYHKLNKKFPTSTTQEVDKGVILLSTSDSTDTNAASTNAVTPTNNEIIKNVDSTNKPANTKNINPVVSTNNELVQNTDYDSFLSNNLKLSSTESITNTNSYKIVIPLILLLTVLIGVGFQIYKKVKKI